MSKTKSIVCILISAVLYIAGFAMINTDAAGKLSAEEFAGYMLCTLSGIVLLSTFIAILILKDGKE